MLCTRAILISVSVSRFGHIHHCICAMLWSCFSLMPGTHKPHHCFSAMYSSHRAQHPTYRSTTEAGSVAVHCIPGQGVPQGSVPWLQAPVTGPPSSDWRLRSAFTAQGTGHQKGVGGDEKLRQSQESWISMGAQQRDAERGESSLYEWTAGEAKPGEAGDV